MKIYISSTYEDLKEYREAVADTIGKLGHKPIVFEDFGISTQSPLALVYESIANSDVFIGLYAHRYGAILQGENYSFIELEFRKARELGKPLFIYCVDPEYPWPPKLVDRGQEKTKLNSFLKNVFKTKTIALFTSPSDLVAKVAADLTRMSHFESITALHTLPPPPPDFTGRESEVEHLIRELVSQTNASISGIAGMGGIGKTALALVVANKLTEKYPDAQLYLDLQGTSKAPLDSIEVMSQVIHAFEPQADLRKASREELESIYLSTLAGKRVLLLMDNVANAEQIKPLVPPQCCALLVTSRSYFTLPGLIPIRLDILQENEAVDLLLKLCPRVGELANEIAQLCGYLPVALRIAGSTLAERIDLPSIEYVHRLRDHKTRLETLKSDADPDLNVESSFELSYNLLSLTQQISWRTLAVFPAPFKRDAAIDVWAVSNDTGGRYLSAFVRYSLLEYDEASGRYSLHNLLAEFANKRMSKKERKVASAHYARHYLKVAETANELYLKGGKDSLSGLALFDSEWPHIQAGQAWAASVFEKNEEAAQLCSSFPLVSKHCLDLRLRPRDRISWLDASIRASGKINKQQNLSTNLTNLGSAYSDIGDMHKAMDYYEQAIAINRQIGNPRSEAITLRNLGLVYFHLGEASKAIDYYEQAIAINRQIGDRRSEAATLSNLGLAYFHLKETHKAIECYEKALSTAREIGDRLAESAGLSGLGNVYTILDNPAKAIAYHLDALVISGEIGNREGQGVDLFNLGETYAHMQEWDKAIKYTEAALSLFEAIDLPPRIAQTQQQLEKLKQNLQAKDNGDSHATNRTTSQ